MDRVDIKSLIPLGRLGKKMMQKLDGHDYPFITIINHQKPRFSSLVWNGWIAFFSFFSRGMDSKIETHDLDPADLSPHIFLSANLPEIYHGIPSITNLPDEGTTTCRCDL